MISKRMVWGPSPAIAMDFSSDLARSGSCCGISQRMRSAMGRRWRVRLRWLGALMGWTSAVPKRGHSKRGRTQKHANACERAQMSEREREIYIYTHTYLFVYRQREKTRASPRKSAKERFCVKIANNQVWHNQAWPNSQELLQVLSIFWGWSQVSRFVFGVTTLARGPQCLELILSFPFAPS